MSQRTNQVGPDEMAIQAGVVSRHLANLQAMFLDAQTMAEIMTHRHAVATARVAELEKRVAELEAGAGSQPQPDGV